jgi:hypothetical protein
VGDSRYQRSVSGTDTDQPVRYDREEGVRSRRGRRALYRTFNTVVALVVAAGVLEAMAGPSVYGVDTATASATQRGTTIDVRHATATRGQLAVPLEIRVSRPGGFPQPVVLTLTADYLDVFITQGPDPAPSKETATDKELFLTFDPPPGDTFQVRWDLAAQPVGFFTTATARVAVLDSAQRPVVAVDFDTKIRP